jgi:hypothetical protein
VQERIPAQRIKKQRVFRIGLSLFLCFHLSCIILAQNKRAYLGYRFSSIIEPYTNVFEIGTAWSFFSPDPGPPMHLEWELLDEKGKTLKKGQEPQPSHAFQIPERQNRRIAMSYLMAASDEKADRLMAPYLCKHYPQADSVNLWRVVYITPSFNDVAAGNRKVGDEKGTDRKFVSHSFCEARK